MTTSVLIIGSKGMLGQALTKTFSSDKNYEVTAWDKEEVNLTDLEATREKIVELWPDIIINASAYNAVDLCENDDIEYKKAQKLNTVVPGELAEMAAGLQAVFVHYSTDYVFDGKRPVYKSQSGVAPGCCGQKCPGCQYKGSEETLDYFAYREQDLPRPLSRYGKTKYEGELAVERKGSKYFIVRLSKLFGAPAIIEGAKKSFFDIMMEVGKNNSQVKAVDSETSCFTYAPDLAEATKLLIQSQPSFGIYHLTNEGAVTWYEAVVELYKLIGLDTKILPVKPEEFPRPAPRAESSVLINTKLDESIAPMRPWTEALREHLNL